jgi:hypothetical protein
MVLFAGFGWFKKMPLFGRKDRRDQPKVEDKYQLRDVLGT